jgi:hypothetical protein
MLRTVYLSVFSVLAIFSSSVSAQGLSPDNIDGIQNPLSGSTSGLGAQTSPLGLSGSAGSETGQGQLNSPPISHKFYEIAYELANSKDIRDSRLEEAIVFLTAALKLDSNAMDIRALLIEFACRQTEQNYSNLIYNLLESYVDDYADLGIVRTAIMYLLEQQNSRQEREKLLEQMLGTLGSRNIVLASDIATILGALKAEKADMEAAQFYFIQAYRNNRYNRLAFEKLAQIAPEQIVPATYLERTRLALREDPVDIESAIAFARNAEQLQLYDTAAEAYKYCADLFTYLYPSEQLPDRIYLPWAISCYNSKQNLSECIEITKRIRRDLRFDLRLEAIAGRAAIKMGDGEMATLILQAAEENAKRLLKQNSQAGNLDSQAPIYANNISIEQLAWFYCFALPFPARALDWANKAYEADPNSPVTASILAYSLTMNEQFEWAKPLISNFERNQISDLALAKIQLSEGQKTSAIETLMTAIARDPGSFAAERAKDILAEQGQEYFPPVDPNSILTMMQTALGDKLVPVFVPPEKIISDQFNIRGTEFSYGTEFNGILAIVNNSDEPLIISNNAMFKGNVRVDANITGDISKKIPNLVSTQIRTAFLIQPDRSILVPLRLITGELRKTLLTYPQASLNIEFTLYLDPVVLKDGKIANRITSLEPVKVRVQRPGIKLTDSYLRNQFNSITEGQLSQKIQTAQLFVGLLMEQQAISSHKASYNFMYEDWITPLIMDALVHRAGFLRNNADDGWIVKIYTMADMISLPLNTKLIFALADNLSDEKWPVRMMAVYLLAKSPESRFGKVLDWTANNDPSKIVRDMAAVLGSSVTSQP